jgi:hypothetical protein
LALNGRSYYDCMSALFSTQKFLSAVFTFSFVSVYRIPEFNERKISSVRNTPLSLSALSSIVYKRIKLFWVSLHYSGALNSQLMGINLLNLDLLPNK